MVHENPESPRHGPRQESKEVKPNSRIGLSLSLCIQDILEGKIKEEEVKQIFANVARIEDAIIEYKKVYWKIDPEKAEAIVNRLWAAGKVKLRRPDDQYHNISEGHWLEGKQTEGN